MYISGLGATAGGFDYTAAARAVASALPSFGPERYALVLLGPSGARGKGFVYSRADAQTQYTAIEPKIGVGSLAYVGLLTNKGFVMDEKLDPIAGQRPIDPYNTPLPPPPAPTPPPVAVTTPAQVEAVLPQPKASADARRAGSMMTWLLLGVGAIGLAFYAKQRRVA